MSQKTPIQIQRIKTDASYGLTDAEVQARQKAKLTNRVTSSSGKPYWKIFTDNIFTYFNLIWAIIIAVIIALGEWGELLFSGIIIANTAIAIFQEIRAKQTVEKLTMVTAPKVKIRRNGQDVEYAAEDIVRDDILLFTAGNQIPADCYLTEGAVEVNESLLTGESDAVKKNVGDMLLAGSFIISGTCSARADRVGDEAYIQTVAAKAKKFKAPNSYLFRDINRIIKVIGIAIIPLAVLMYFNNLSEFGNVHDALMATCGSLEGMIPAGMFLLITVALSMGVIRLAGRRTMVKDPYSIEMLSRTDMLCLDKTGTITDGTMRVCGDEALCDLGDIDLASAMASVLAAQKDRNFTSEALAKHYTAPATLTPTYIMPFSSKRKCSATAFAGFGTLALGAPEFLHIGEMPADIADRIRTQAEDGRRVLMLAYASIEIAEDALPDVMQPFALIFLEDHIREEAPDTIRWFRENGVSVKIISGDNPATVSCIARRVGVPNAEKYLSLDGMTPEEAALHAEEYTVFGRVTPEQKHALVVALKKNGHVVSMTGDGVNDTMALKEADCSIAMADGSDAAKGLSNIVLLDNNFASLPSVVKEGRQVINNVERSSTLFLMKTFFAISLSIICLVSGRAYPFLPSGMLMFEVFIDGIPSVILAFQPNDKRIEGRFISGVLKRCLPSGCLILLSVVSVMVLDSFSVFTVPGEYGTLCALALAGTGFIALLALCFPFNKIRIGCVAFSFVGVTLATLIGGSHFGLEVFTPTVWLVFAAIMVLSIPLFLGLDRLFALAWKAKIPALKKSK